MCIFGSYSDLYMAKQIKVLKCPQCGNTKPTTIGKEHYRCDKCKTEFFLDNDDVNINVNHRFDRPQQQTRTDSKAGKIIAGLIAFVVIGSILSTVLGYVSDYRSRNRSSTTQTAARKPSSKYLFTMPISVRGEGVALNIERRRLSDSVYAVFRNIATGNVLKEQALASKKEVQDKIVHRHFRSDNTDYLIINKNQIYQVDPARYALNDFSAAICSRKPALEAGLMKAEFVPEINGEGFKLHTNLGKDLYYFPVADVLCTDKAFRYMTVDKPLESARPVTYYLFQNKESAHSSNVAQLLEITYTFNAGGPENKLMEANANGLKNKEKHRIISYKAVTEEQAYFSPEVLYSDKEQILIAYRPSLANDAGTNVELLDTNGKTIWKRPFKKALQVSAVIPTKDGFMLQTGADQFTLIGKDGKSEQAYKL